MSQLGQFHKTVRLPILNPGIDLKLIVGGLLILVTPAAVAAPPLTDMEQMPRQMVTDFARCVVTRHRREASDYVLRTTPPWQEAAVWARRRLADARCIPAETTRENARAVLSVHENQLRPLLAEILVREDYPTFNASLISTAQPLDYGKLVDNLWPLQACKNCKPAQLKQVEWARARTNALLAPLVFGECVVRTDPENAHKLVVSDLGSSQQSAVIRSLGPALRYCVAYGLQFNTTLAELRKSLALNYYRLARAPRMDAKP